MIYSTLCEIIIKVVSFFKSSFYLTITCYHVETVNCKIGCNIYFLLLNFKLSIVKGIRDTEKYIKKTCNLMNYYESNILTSLLFIICYITVYPSA